MLAGFPTVMFSSPEFISNVSSPMARIYMITLMHVHELDYYIVKSLPLCLKFCNNPLLVST